MTDDLENIDKQDFSERIPESECSIFWHVLSQLIPGMSLNRMTLPTFILETRSTLERFGLWMIHADILRQVATEEDPVIRCLHVATWLISGLHIPSNKPKKPYNSLLGEVCRATLQFPDGTICGTYLAEQVSHHPPVSAFQFTDRVGNSVIWGHAETRSKYLGNSVSLNLHHEGTRANFECLSRGETYEFNFPDMYVCGLLIGSLLVEVCGTARIQCLQTGVAAKILFKAKPLLRGRYNKFRGSVSLPGKSKKTKVIQFKGRWSAFMKSTDLRSKRTWLSFDVRHQIPLTIVPPNLEEQCPYESQYIWQNVTRYLNENDTKSATEHKFALEEKQRAEREYFNANNIEWELQCFHLDEALKRYIPDNLNLTPYSPGEPSMEMPPFHVPPPIQRATDEGIVPVMSEVHRQAEEKVQAALAAQ
jgi:hypothetical protein